MNYRKTVVLLLILLSSAIALKASNTDSTVDIKGNWAKSTIKNFEITRCRDKSNVKEGRFLHQCTTELAKVTVADSTRAGYTINWVYTDVSLDNSYASADAITRYILQITKGMTIKFTIDSNGMFGTVVNWNDIKSFLTARADSMSSLLGNVSVEDISSVKSKLINLINSKDQLQNVLLQDIQLYFSIYGYTLNRKAPLGYDGFFSNVLGGDPFPSHGTINLTSIDTVTHNCEITWHQQSDSAKVREILMKSATNEAAEAGHPAPKSSDILTIKVYDDYYFLFNSKAGWVQKLIYKRTTATDKMQQIDSVDFRVY